MVTGSYVLICERDQGRSRATTLAGGASESWPSYTAPNNAPACVTHHGAGL